MAGERQDSVQDWRPACGIDQMMDNGRRLEHELAPHHMVPGESPFPPIGEYAFLSDCESTALVAPSGNIEWLCLPRMDSPSVFGAILDRDAGGFRVGPADIMVPAARRYLPGTNVLETSWATPTGWMIVRDLLVIGPWHHETDHSDTHRRAPTDYEADHILLRHIRCVNGEVQLTVDCEPVFDYGRSVGEWRWTEDGYHQGACRSPDGRLDLILTSDLNIGFEGPRALGRTMIKEGETRFVALSWGSVKPPRSCKEAYPGWSGRHTTGSTGSLAAISRTIRGEASSSGRHSR
jgi:GH15 family glucan-1,4-alpha-glucosidase